MDQERNSLRMGLWVIFLATLLRLAGSGIFYPVAAFLQKPETASFLLYLQTGRVSHAVEPVQTWPAQTLPVSTTGPETVPEETELPSFSETDAGFVDISYYCDYDPDIAALLTAPLSWDLTQQEPAVLILHTHATECYTTSDGEAYSESSAYRTLDTGYNMVSIGDRLTELLEAAGISVLHDSTLHDAPSYSDAYSYARATIERYLAQYPSICLVLDLHRDALSLDSQTQLTTHALVNGQDSAQLMLVVGTDAGGLTHPQWQQNLALAVKLHATLQVSYPGLCRSISFRSQRFNQDLSPGALIVEVGAAGNTHQEAMVAVEALAEAIITLSKGTQ